MKKYKLALNKDDASFHIVYIIGHRSADDYRKQNLAITLDWLLKVKTVLSNVAPFIVFTIVVVEQSENPTVKEMLHSDINYIFISNDGFYNRGWGFNVGARAYPKADYYFFADNDIVMSIADMVKVVSDCKDYEAVNPYKAIFDSREQIHDSHVLDQFYDGKETVDSLAQKGFIQGQRQYTTFSGGIVGVEAKAYFGVSGWDERFRGRGWEDYAFTAKINLFLRNMITMNFNAVHLYHPWETSTTKVITQELDKEYMMYKPYDYIQQIIYSHNVFGNDSKYGKNENRSYESILSPEEVQDRYDLAKRRFLEVEKIVKAKHDDEKFIYLNLSDRHDCRQC